MFRSPGDRHVHHHGILAGLGAGTAAVLVCAVFMLSVWHRVSGTIATAVTVIVYALMAVILAAALFAVAYLGLRLWHHAIHPETLTRHGLRAEVIPPPAAETPAIPAPAPLAALPPVTHNWHLNDPATAAAVIRAVADTTTEGN